jgi:hypothetical protein
MLGMTVLPSRSDAGFSIGGGGALGATGALFSFLNKRANDNFI